ncbi:peptidase U32 family protein [Frateuria sp. GZRe12]|uniref:ubiquinone anaerobic biosynthesis protein UbiU n=1 Tax=Frateuria sp. GZRe12 TaxID=3351533 RepID=UPI003EDC4B11
MIRDKLIHVNAAPACGDHDARTSTDTEVHMQLVCPAGNLPALQAAIAAGADAVYVGLRDETNARAFPGLNFSDAELHQGVAHAHAHGRKVYLALNTYPDSARLAQWHAAVDKAAALGCDAIIAAELAVLDYASRTHPTMARHLSVQGSATTAPALRYMHERFGISRAVLPRVLSIQQVERLCETSPVPLEVFAFGSLCIMVEGRCQLSSYVTGASPNRHGVCSPAKYVRWNEHDDGRRSVRLNDVLIDRFEPSEPAGYPTVCKGRFEVGGETFHALEEPTSLNTLELLPRLARAGVAALKIEGRQRGVAYVTAVTHTWRDALDRYRAAPDAWSAQPAWQTALTRHAEGHQTTLGPYHRRWH